MTRAHPMAPGGVLAQVTPTHLARLAFYAILAVVVTWTLADPDLWGHVLFGRDIIATWSIPRVDHYSFTADREWINHEWLAEVVMFGAYRVAGATGLIALKAVVVLLSLGVVSWVIRGGGAHGVLHDVVLLIAAVGTLPRTICVRPQLFSVLLFAVLLAVLTAVDRGRHRALVLLPLVFAAWANFHGGWLVGLVVLGIWGAARIVAPGASWPLRAVVIATIGAALAATAVNPYGVGLWRFLWQTVGFGRPYIADWLPLWRTPTLILPWVLTASVGALALIRSGFRKSPTYLLIVVTLACASAEVSRLDAFFSLSVVMLLAPHLAQVWPRAVGNQRQTPVPTIAAALAAVGVILVSALIPGAWLTARNLNCLTVDERALPESEAVPFVLENRLRGRMLTYFDYGEYAIWHFTPQIQVSMDGRRETIYSDDVIAAHLSAYFEETGASAYARQLGVDYVWLLRRLPAVRDLERDGWVRIFAGVRSVILAKPENRVYRLPAAISGSRCFPGP